MQSILPNDSIFCNGSLQIEIEENADDQDHEKGIEIAVVIETEEIEAIVEIEKEGDLDRGIEDQIEEIGMTDRKKIVIKIADQNQIKKEENVNREEVEAKTNYQSKKQIN